MNTISTIRRTACVLALSVCAASPLLAKDSGLYLGVNVGQAEYKTNNQQLLIASGGSVTVTGTQMDDNDIAFALNVGYRVNPYVGVELGFTDLGELEIVQQVFTSPTVGAFTRLNLGAKGLTFAGVGTLPLGSFELYAKAGFMYAETTLYNDATLTFGGAANSPFITLRSDTYELLYSVGAGYSFGENFFGKVEWMRVTDVGNSANLANITEPDIDVINLGFQYRF